MVAPTPVAKALLLLAALCVSSAAAQQQRTLNQAADGCSNTQSGRWFIADDRGMVCPRDSLNYGTGCCTDGEQHACTSCQVDDKCCSQYEYCVSCCLKPENKPEQHMGSLFRGRNKPETGLWSTPFDYCQAVCRTTARSTQHENAFILERRHCFSKLGRPRVPVLPAPPLPPHITMVAGGPGQNCDVACALKQMVCRGEHFVGINDCNSLRAKFMCEAGCGESAPDQTEFPGYLEGSAPKHQRPAFCAFLPPFAPDTAPAFNCTRGNGSVRRLCPCEPLPAAVVAAATQQAAAAEQTAGDSGGVAAKEADGASAGEQQQQQVAAAVLQVEQEQQQQAKNEVVEE
ncbi:hypothetical protein D9Q98_005949 [Chlorella vulgaris]|uniref:SREBP regulating gene protein n=1 Tax=Chlorella vulgaris TaxID=3077 RepID=A0A9D4Z1F0_CHLVU|nr:hypothetical protein D9Q98_005949 [Chlorella vulgaris]